MGILSNKENYGKGSGVLGILFILGGRLYGIWKHDDVVPLVLYILGGVLFVLFLLLNYSSIRGGLKERGIRRGLSSVLTTVFIFATLVGIYIIVKSNFKYFVDVTEENLYELSNQTKEVLKELDFPLDIKVFAAEKDMEEAEGVNALPTLLRFYVKDNKNIKVSYINPQENPLIFKSYDLSAQDLGAVVLIKRVPPDEISIDSMEHNILSKLDEDEKKIFEVAYKKGKGIYNKKANLSTSLEEEVVGLFDKVNYRYNTPVVIRQRDLFRGRNYQGESKITSGITSLLEVKKKVLYYTVGHGEKDLKTIYNTIQGLLSLENYIVKALDLTKAVPKDSSAVLIAGPQRGFNSLEEENLIEYSNRGGNIYMLLDPVFQYRKRPNRLLLQKFLLSFGVSTDKGFIFDVPNLRKMRVNVGNIGGLSLAEVRLMHISNYLSHKIVNPLKSRNITTFFFGLRPLYFDFTKEGLTGEYLLETSEKALVKLRGKTDQVSQKFDKNVDKKGTQSFGIAIKKEIKVGGEAGKLKSQDNKKGLESRLIVIGDSDFINEEYASGDNGTDLFMNGLNWLTGQVKKISLRPKERKRRDMLLKEKDITLIWYTSVLLLPFSIVGIGLYVYRRRRKARG